MAFFDRSGNDNGVELGGDESKKCKLAETEDVGLHGNGSKCWFDFGVRGDLVLGLMKQETDDTIFNLRGICFLYRR